MSMDLDSPQIPKPKKHKKPKEKNGEGTGKKRQRHSSEDLEPASPTKKRRSTKRRSTSPIAHSIDKTPIDPPTSPFYKQTSSLYLPLSPISQRYALYGLRAEHLSPLVLTYYPPFHGVIISYSNARLSSNPKPESEPAYAQSIDEYAASFTWLTADFILFKPQKEDVIEGWVNLQNESNIGLLCLNLFNVTIERKRLPKSWKWMLGGTKSSGKRKSQTAEGQDIDSDEVDETCNLHNEHTLEDTQGYFRDENGKKVEGLIRFRVKDLETSRGIERETGFLNIEGTMLSKEDEKTLQEQEETRSKEKGRQQPRHAMTGAVTHEDDGSMVADQTLDTATSVKHRVNY